MARINVEKEWWSDPRRGRLIAAMGCPFKADGAMLAAWQLAQDYWFPRFQLIPKSTWTKSGLPNALIDVGLADIINGEVAVKGRRDHFEWLFKSQQGGKNSAESRKKDFKPTSSPLQQDPEPTSTGLQPLPLPLPLPPSSNSNSFSSSSSVNVVDQLDQEKNKEADGVEWAPSPFGKWKPGITENQEIIGKLIDEELAKNKIELTEPVTSKNGNILVPPSHVVDNTNENIINLKTGEAMNGFSTSDKR